MLNYILPPIIIIISVSILIMFLFRKAAQIPAGEFTTDENKGENEKNSAKAITVMSQFGLKLLERLMHHSKLLSLKFHNVSNVWFQTIREKRQQGIRKAQIQKEEEEKRLAENMAGYQINEKAKEEIETGLMHEKPVSRPMVRDAVTMPQQMKAKEKNKLEDALIRRIAVNPRDIEAYERLGDYYLESQNFQDSLECFKQVLHLSPAHHKARLRIRRLERMK